jgi:transcriptional regulator with XRE-family HTH domain
MVVNNEILKLVRQVAGMSQRELAEKAGIHHSFISRLEAGKKRMSPVTERKIKQVFHDEGITETDIALLLALVQNRKGDK